jgi:hemerythrin superfamily protein
MTTLQTKATKATTSTKSQDAITLLRADHQLVSGLFEEYEKASTKAMKKKLVRQICMELSVHAQVEEEIFYPAVQKALKDHALVPEAIIEHDTFRTLIAEVEDVEPDGEMYDAKIKVLCEYVEHHVKEEQEEMFPKAKATKLDMMELGDKISTRKQTLMAARS